MTETADDLPLLMRQAQFAVAHDDDSPESEAGWAALGRLRRLASRDVLEAANSACDDSCASRRDLGATILGQLGAGKQGAEPVFGEERFHALAKLLAAEIAGPADPNVLRAACLALSHLHDPRAIPFVLPLSRHPDDGVRFSVVRALSQYDDESAIEGLIALSTDTDAVVRDWATFGLGQMIATDTPAIRAALRARLGDPDTHARDEAIEGLLRRGDAAAVPAVARELGRRLTFELLYAAERIASPAFCEALRAATERGLTVECDGTVYDLTEEWRSAMRACGCGLDSGGTLDADAAPRPRGVSDR